jgi:hypothetical protein
MPFAAHAAKPMRFAIGSLKFGTVEAQRETAYNALKI